MKDFEIELDNEPERPDYDLHDNVLHDVIDHSRSKQVLNEEQTILTLLTYITGYLPDSTDYGAAKIRGGSSGGKTHMKEKVVERLFAMVMDTLYKTTSTSAKGIIDDEEWDTARVAALDEMNKIPTEMMELLKSTYGDDGGFTYGRSMPDTSKAMGFSTNKTTKKPLPVIFMLADENAMEVEEELETRFMDIKVDETEEKNAAVHDMKWGHGSIKLAETDATYGEELPGLERALQWHIKELPVDTDVVIPTGEGRFDGDDWNASAVAKPLFNFKTSASTRASRMVASLFKASALLNHHARDTVVVDDEEKIVPKPEDLANLLACRSILLNMTHGLDEKKFAILDAIIERGGAADREGTKLQATITDIQDYLQNSADIATIGKTELRKLLDEMDENYLINITDNPDDRRENLYVYDGADTIGEPNIWDFYDHFKSVEDPIRRQPIEETIRAQQEKLGKQDPKDLLDQGASQETLGGGGDLNDLQADVLTAMHEALNGVTVAADDVEALDYEHMLGAAPLAREGDTVTPERPATSDDIVGTLFDPTNGHWSGQNRGEVKARITDAVGTLQQRGYWKMEQNTDGSVSIEVQQP